MAERASVAERIRGPEIHRDRLADQAYEVLRQRILSGGLKPGERLGVPVLAQELGLSRSTVPEAVQRLVSDAELARRRSDEHVLQVRDRLVRALTAGPAVDGDPGAERGPAGTESR